MPYGPFQHGWPYSNFHDLNLDWVLQTVRNLAEEWAQVQTDWTNEQEAFESFKKYVNEKLSTFQDWFDNLDVQTEINNKLDEMAADGSLTELLQPIANQIFDTANDALQQAGAANSRISSLMLSNESTEGNSELLDIKNSWTGGMYKTPGDAVRSQAQNNWDAFIYVLRKAGFSISPEQDYGGLDMSGYTSYHFTAPTYRWGVFQADRGGLVYNVTAVVFSPESIPMDDKYLNLQVFGLTDRTYTLKKKVPVQGWGLLETTESKSFYAATWPPIEVDAGDMIVLEAPVIASYSYTAYLYKAGGKSWRVPKENDSFASSQVVESAVRFNIGLTFYPVQKTDDIVKPYVIVDQAGNGDYTSVVDAVASTPENTPIIILPGVYQGTVQAFTKRIILIGVDRESCILESNDGRYQYPCVNGSCGYFENLTFRCPYVSGVSQEIGTNTGAYAFHCENEYGSGKSIEFHHCTLWSDFSPALGMGTRKDFTAVIDDCILENHQIAGRGDYTDDGTLGAFFIHDSVGMPGTAKVTVKNSVFIGDMQNAMCIYTLKNAENNIVFTFVGNCLKSSAGYDNNIFFRNGNAFDQEYFHLAIGWNNSNPNLNS